MENKLVLLKLVLEALGLPLNISSRARRKTLQKAVYLAQQLFPPLDYRYNWYVLGPYSPALARDYYSLSTGAEVSTQGFQLSETARRKISTLRPWLKPPPEVNLPSDSWLELLASLHYLITSVDAQNANQILGDAKPHLVPFREQAMEALRSLALLR